MTVHDLGDTCESARRAGIGNCFVCLDMVFPQCHVPATLVDAYCSGRDQPAAHVQLPGGPITCRSAGRYTIECLGIPYGTQARWKRPTLATATWTAPVDATKWGPVCWQAGATPCNQGDTCSEDCLVLNVYAPAHPPPASVGPANGGPGLPVVVWIHGGAYQSGSSHGLNGTFQVEASGGGIIFVTIEYRLNVFGFLGSRSMASRDPAGSVGNYGLQDQRLALEWVSKNIAAFGGDKDNVMIDGCSAGAGSTANHATNEHSWPYNLRVISI